MNNCLIPLWQVFGGVNPINSEIGIEESRTNDNMDYICVGEFSKGIVHVSGTNVEFTGMLSMKVMKTIFKPGNL